MRGQERAKVNVVCDEELSQFVPVRVSIVEIEFRDGSRESERVDAVRGTPRNPMSSVEVMDKARDLVAPILRTEKTEQIIHTVYAIETVANIRNLCLLIRHD